MKIEQEMLNLFCHDLPTHPANDGRLILVTGANGYIGGRLIPELIERGYRLRLMVRRDIPELRKKWPQAEFVIADALNEASLEKALKGVHTAFYFIHSLGLGYQYFEAADIQIAKNFRLVAEKQNLNRIIYLGGLGDSRSRLSPHLDNRIKVAQELSKGKTPLTVLRAAMIIGSGSASYEILINLVKNTPIFFIPKWAKTKCQPISIRGVIKYLVGIMEADETAGKSFDIGGPEVLTYIDKLKITALVLGKKRLFLPTLITNPKFYAGIISLITPVSKSITEVLVEGCKNEVVCQNEDIKRYLDIDLLSFEEAIRRALLKEKT